MRVLITGGAGLLGSALVSRPPRGAQVFATRRRQAPPGGSVLTLDLADAAAVRHALGDLRPDQVVHTAYDPSDHAGSLRMAEVVAETCGALGIPLVHVSTDRVLDGEAAPYDEAAPAAPIEPYGAAKAEAERAVRALVPDAAIVRTSVIVGTRPPDRQTAQLLADLSAGVERTWFVDEIRTPIHVGDLAAQIWELVEMERGARAGVWNLVGPEAVSRFHLAVLLARSFGVSEAGLREGSHRDSPTPRPRDLSLSTARADAALRARARPISQAIAEEL